MALEWLRFGVVALLLIGGVICFIAAAVGVFRFGYVLNRMHAGGIGDTLGLALVIAAMCVASGVNLDSLKLILILALMWFTSPVSTHFLSQVEYYTNATLYSHLKRRAPEEKTDR